MIQKLDLVSNIEKYYLNGTVESVKWGVSNNKLHVDFIAPNQDLVGHVECDVDLVDSTLGIFNTSALLKMLHILDMDILINVEQQYQTPVRLQIEDSNFSLQYSLADPYIIAPVPSIEEPEYEIEFDIDNEFITRFSKAKSALGSDTRNIFKISTHITEDGNKQVKLVLGEPTSHSNKIEFTAEAKFQSVTPNLIPFNSLHVKEILSANKGEGVEAIGYLSTNGLLKLEFKTDTSSATYYLPELRVG